MTYEEWLVEWTGTITGISGTQVYCGTLQQAEAFVAAHYTEATVWSVSRQVVSRRVHRVYRTAPSATTGTSASTPAANQVLRIGKPNLPPGESP